MAYEQRDNSGSLFRNDRCETERHPTHKGTAKIDGRDYWVSAWIKEAKDGSRFFSLAFDLKEGSPATPKPASKAPARPVVGSAADPQARPPFDDSIPF